MVGDYVYIQNYAKRGTLAISSSVFDEIVSIAIENIKGVKIKKQEKILFFLPKPVKCVIKNGRVFCDIEVIISKDFIVNDVCVKIQEEVADAITCMTEFVPFQINIKVLGIE